MAVNECMPGKGTQHQFGLLGLRQAELLLQGVRELDPFFRGAFWLVHASQGKNCSSVVAMC